METINLPATIARTIYNVLHEKNEMLGANGWLERYLELQSKYAEVVSSIQNGFGYLERPDNENPAEVLKELREVYNISANECSEMLSYSNQLMQFEYATDHARLLLRAALAASGALPAGRSTAKG